MIRTASARLRSVEGEAVGNRRQPESRKGYGEEQGRFGAAAVPDEGQITIV